MKRIALWIPVMLLAGQAHAGPYVAIGYQVSTASVEDRDLRSPVVAGQTVDLSGSDSSESLKLALGYDFNERWGIELSGYEVEVSGSREIPLSPTREDERDASLDGRHLLLTPYYNWKLSEQWNARVFAGVVYGDYDFEQKHEISVENAPDELLFRSSRSESEFGGVAGASLSYAFWRGLSVLADVHYARTSLIGNGSASIGLAYRF